MGGFTNECSSVPPFPINLRYANELLVELYRATHPFSLAISEHSRQNLVDKTDTCFLSINQFLM